MNPLPLHPHQSRAVAQCRQMLAKLRAEGKPLRILLVGPCGVGKTYMSSDIMYEGNLKGSACVFMAHGRQLVYQKSATLDKWGIPHSVLMDGEEYYISRNTVVSSDTYWRRCFKGELAKLAPKVLIVDEAHLAFGDTFQQMFKHHEDAVVIGLTATPALGTGKSLGGFYQGMVIAATYEELLAGGFLVPPVIYAPFAVDTTGVDVNSATGEFSQPQVGKLFDKPQLIGNVVRNWKELAEGRPTVVFASGVDHSIHLAEAFCEAGLAFEHIDAVTEQVERERIFAGLRSGRINGVCNYGVMRVGVDLPVVSCLQLAVAMNSLNCYLQTCGRGFRTFPGKRDCILIDHGSNVHRLGWPTEDHEWSLTTESTVKERDDAKATADTKPREPICCPKCAAMRPSGPVCHNCGHKHTRTGLKILMRDGTLELVKRKPKPKPVNDEAKYWGQCLGIAANRGMTLGQAKGMFNKKMQKWPDDCLPNVPDRDMNKAKVAELFPGFVRGKKVADA